MLYKARWRFIDVVNINLQHPLGYYPSLMDRLFGVNVCYVLYCRALFLLLSARGQFILTAVLHCIRTFQDNDNSQKNFLPVTLLFMYKFIFLMPIHGIPYHIEIIFWTKMSSVFTIFENSKSLPGIRISKNSLDSETIPGMKWIQSPYL